MRQVDLRHRLKAKTRHAVQRLRSLSNPSYDPRGWQDRPLEFATGYLGLASSSTNHFLWERADLADEMVVLEIGSNCGNRLLEVAGLHPEITFVGVDINTAATCVGNREARKRGLTNISFFQFDLRSRAFLSFLSENSVDLVVSWACLMYLHPRHLTPVLNGLVKHSTSLIFIEPLHEGTNKSRLYGSTNWQHNYVSLLCKELSRVHPERGYSVSVDLVPLEVWHPDGGGARLVSASWGISE